MNELFEKELRNTSINDKSLADYVIENYVPMSVIKGIKAELHATAEMHDDGDYYLREEWIDYVFDKYRNEVRE